MADPIDTAALRAVHRKATPGPYVSSDGIVLGRGGSKGMDGFHKNGDPAFCAAACNALIPLCDEVERLREALSAVSEAIADQDDIQAHAIILIALGGQP